MTTISSKLNSYINYNKETKIYKNDRNKQVSVYKINLTKDKISSIIALGEIRYDQRKHNIAYCPVYLILGDDIHNKIEVKPIGIYEFWASAEENLKDKEGDLDLHLIDGPLLYNGIDSKKLKNLLNNKPLLTDISEREEEDLKQEHAKAVQNADFGLISSLEDKMELMKTNTGEKIAISAKPVIISIVMEDDDDVDIKDTYTSKNYHKIVKEYQQMGLSAPKKNWLQKKFHDHNYKLVRNKGAGDCFFSALRQAFDSIGIKTTEKNLREKLSTNFTTDIFNEYRSRRDMFSGFSKKNQKEQEDVALKHKALKKLKKDKQKLFSEAKKTIGQKSVKNDPRYKEILEIQKKMDEISGLFYQLQKEYAANQQLLSGFNFMTGINTLEDFKTKIKSSDYWADAATLKIIEEVLNIKIIVIDKENRKGLIHCTDASDTIKAKGWFKPKYYVMLDLDQGKINQPHYQLVMYQQRKMFKYHELPFSIKEEIKNSCLVGSDSGIYNYIPKFNKLIKNIDDDDDTDDDDKEQEVAIQDADAEKIDNEETANYDKNVVFVFHSKSAHKKPGKGIAEKIPKDREDDFKELSKEKHWRKVLSNFWVVVKPFELDGHTWNSVEHYYQASKFKDHTEGSDKHEFYKTFTAESGSGICKDPAKAKSAGGADKSHKYRGKHILMDDDFFNGKHKIAMERGQRAKYTTDIYSQKILLLTKDAKLEHLMKARGKTSKSITFYDTMKIRNELNNK